MEVRKLDSFTTKRAPVEYFTGVVWQEALVEVPEPGRLRAFRVTFEAGARTAWHTHPLGQTLVVVSGTGLVQSWNEPARVIRPGDVVWIPAGEKHWHGAAANSVMAHLALQEALNGTTAEWMEHVSDEQYAAAQVSG